MAVAKMFLTTLLSTERTDNGVLIDCIGGDGYVMDNEFDGPTLDPPFFNIELVFEDEAIRVVVHQVLTSWLADEETIIDVVVREDGSITIANNENQCTIVTADL